MWLRTGSHRQRLGHPPYTYDPAGNRTSKGNYLNGVTSNYGYDPLYELTQVTQGGSTTESYSYDPVGNRLSSVGVPLYNYNPSNELTSNSSGSYTYDETATPCPTPAANAIPGTSRTAWLRRLCRVPTAARRPSSTIRSAGASRNPARSAPPTTSMTGRTYWKRQTDPGNVLARYTIGHAPEEAPVDEPLAELRSGTASFYKADGLDPSRPSAIPLGRSGTAMPLTPLVS